MKNICFICLFLISLSLSFTTQEVIQNQLFSALTIFFGAYILILNSPKNVDTHEKQGSNPSY
jgi:hypothetical protein